MGHKVNPYGFRLGVIYPWKSNWYAGRDYSEQLHEDIWIRKHIRKRLSRAGISSIDIERKGDQIWVFIRTARPGIVIGRKGAVLKEVGTAVRQQLPLGAFLELFGLKSLRDLPTLRQFTELTDESQVVLERFEAESEPPPAQAEASPDRDPPSDPEGGAEAE